MRIFTIEIFDMNNENTIIIESHKFFNFVARLSNLCNVHFSHKTFAEKQTNDRIKYLLSSYDIRHKYSRLTIGSTLVWTEFTQNSPHYNLHNSKSMD